MVAALALAGYVALALLFPLPALADVRHIDLGKLTQYHPLAPPVFAVFLAAQWAAFFWLLRRIGQATRWLAWAVALAVLVAGALVYPVTAADLFDYLGHAWLLVAYGANPFVFPAEQVAIDEVTRLMAWPDMPVVYGPLWIAGSLIPLVLGPSIWGMVFAHKLLALLMAVLSAVAVARLARQQGLPSDTAAFAFLANPLTVWEVAINGHNDIWMVALVMLGLWAWCAGARATGAAAVGLSALIKFMGGIAVLPLGVDALRRGRPAVLALVAGGALAGIAAGALYLPFWEGPATLASLTERGGFVTTSLPGIVSWLVDDAGLVAAVQLAQTAVFGVLVLALVAGQWRGRVGLLAACGWLFVALIALVTWWYQPWYVLWALAPALVSGDRRLVAVCWAMAIGGMATYLVFQWWPLWNPGGWNFGYAQVAGWLAAWLPAAAVLGSGVRGRAGTRQAESAGAPPAAPA